MPIDQAHSRAVQAPVHLGVITASERTEVQGAH